MRLGFKYAEVIAMPVAEAEGWLSAAQPPKKTGNTYRVKRKKT